MSTRLMPQLHENRNWLPSLLVVAVLHAAAWWGLTHFKDETTTPKPLPVVNVALLSPPEPLPPRVTPPEPPKPQPKQPPPVAAPRPVATDTLAPVHTPTPVEETKSVAAPTPPSPPVAAPAPAVAEAPLEPPRFNAAYLSNPPPNYPLSARRRGAEGTVLIRAEISAGGDPLRVELKKSSGTESLDNAALEAVKKWRFVPAKRGHQAVVAWAEVPITFKLEN